VQAVVASNKVVVVGMGLNPFPAKARKILERNGTPYTYLGYGNYFSQWRPRLALKLWSGWSTFPMIFVNGQLIGGATDLQKLIASRGRLYFHRGPGLQKLLERTGTAADGTVIGRFKASGVRPKMAQKIETYGIRLSDGMFDPDGGA